MNAFLPVHRTKCIHFLKDAWSNLHVLISTIISMLIMLIKLCKFLKLMILKRKYDFKKSNKKEIRFIHQEQIFQRSEIIKSGFMSIYLLFEYRTHYINNLRNSEIWFYSQIYFRFELIYSSLSVNFSHWNHKMVLMILRRLKSKFFSHCSLIFTQTQSSIKELMYCLN